MKKIYLVKKDPAMPADGNNWIGADKLRELSDREDCEFVLWNGTKRLFKRKKLDEYLDKAYSI